MNSLDAPCATVSELVTEYLEGALPAAQTISYETHLVYCASCQLFLRQVRETVSKLHRLPEDALPAEERRRLFDRLGKST